MTEISHDWNSQTEKFCSGHIMPWNLDTCCTQLSPVCQVGMHGISNCDTHLYPPLNSSFDNNKSAALWRITNGMWSGWRTLWDPVLLSPTSALTPLEWPCQEQRGSGSSTSTPVSNVSAPAYINGAWPLLQIVSVVQRNRPFANKMTMLSFTVQSIDLPIKWMAWQFRMTRQLNDCSAPAQRSTAA